MAPEEGSDEEIEEFSRAIAEARTNPASIHLWQPIIAKYSPTLIGECEKAIRMSTDMVKTWLVAGMYAGDPDAEAKASRVLAELGDHSLTLSHSRHISAEKAASIGLRTKALEDDQALQEAVLSVHHAYIQTLEATACIKIIENHQGTAFVKNVVLNQP